MSLKRIILSFLGSSSGIPADAVIEPDGLTPLKEPNGDFVIEP